MKLKLTALAALLGAGVFASIALAHGGPGRGNDHPFAFGKNDCHPVRVHGTVAPLTLTVTSTDRNGQTKTTVVQVGGTGQIVKVSALACQTTTGTTTVLQAKAAFLTARTPRPTTTSTTQTATTQSATTQTGTTSTTKSDHHRHHHGGGDH